MQMRETVVVVLHDNASIEPLNPLMHYMACKGKILQPRLSSHEGDADIKPVGIHRRIKACTHLSVCLL